MIRHILLAILLAAELFMSATGALAQAGGDARRAQANTAVQPMPMTYADLERLYLDGKITAKQYQKYLNEMKSRPVPPPVAIQPAPLPPPSPVSPPAPQRPPAPAPQPLPATPPGPAVSPNKNERINEVEAKMDELIKAKAARDKATNTPPPVATGPKSKRDRLNDLLRLYIEGKITEPEMNERRAKILAEP